MTSKAKAFNFNDETKIQNRSKELKHVTTDNILCIVTIWGRSPMGLYLIS